VVIVATPLTDLFRLACGGAGPLRLCVERAGSRLAEHAFDRPFVRVGRDPRNDLRVDEPDVSPHHCYFQVLDGRVYGVDLGSRTGLRWSEGMRPSGWLTCSDPVRMGGVSLRLANAAPGGRVAPRQQPGLPVRTFDPQRRQIVLEFLAGPPARTWVMNRALALVGHGPTCAVRLRGPGVATFHASLVRTAWGLWVVGLAPDCGVRVNGKGVPWSGLRDGDTLEIGRFVIRIRHNLPVVRIHAPAPTAVGQPATAVVAAYAEPLPVRPGRPENVLAPLVSQFASLQRQMFDQFQQAIYVMVEMFKKMEREQTDLIRQEVDRIRQITRELNRLQTELGRHSPAGSDVSRVRAAGPTARWDVGVPVGRRTGWGPSATAPETIPGEPDGPGATTNAVQPAVRVAPPAGASENEIQTWLYQQIASLQRERQTRLHKLMNFLSGQRRR
jgi:pSer/pThr/pTyr-binding forkhead associated (FHA) protein